MLQWQQNAVFPIFLQVALEQGSQIQIPNYLGFTPINWVLYKPKTQLP